MDLTSCKGIARNVGYFQQCEVSPREQVSEGSGEQQRAASSSSKADKDSRDHKQRDDTKEVTVGLLYRPGKRCYC